MQNNIIKRINHNCILCTICTILPTIRIIKFIPNIPSALYFAIWAVIAYIIIFGEHIRRVNYSMILFIVICFLSLLLNNVDPKFNAGLRLIGFVLIVISIGPVFDSFRIFSIKDLCMQYVLYGMTFITIISFFIYSIAPTLMMTERGNLYGGITIHSMQMSPIAGIVSIFLIHKYLYSKGNNLKNILIICFSAISVISCILAGSRSAIIAMVIAMIVLLKLYCRNNIRKFISISLIIILFCAISSPLWWSYTETVQAKMEYSEETGGGVLSSRSNVWEERINEFKANPLFGCGFATVVSDLSYRGNGLVEPGNGWLFILSSTGIITFFIFSIIYIRYIIYLYKLQTPKADLIIPLLIFIGIHLNAEGYTLSSCTFLFYFLWLIMGYAYSYINNKHIHTF